MRYNPKKNIINGPIDGRFYQLHVLETEACRRHLPGPYLYTSSTTDRRLCVFDPQTSKHEFHHVNYGQAQDHRPFPDLTNQRRNPRTASLGRRKGGWKMWIINPLAAGQEERHQRGTVSEGMVEPQHTASLRLQHVYLPQRLALIQRRAYCQVCQVMVDMLLHTIINIIAVLLELGGQDYMVVDVDLGLSPPFDPAPVLHQDAAESGVIEEIFVHFCFCSLNVYWVLHPHYAVYDGLHFWLQEEPSGRCHRFFSSFSFHLSLALSIHGLQW